MIKRVVEAVVTAALVALFTELAEWGVEAARDRAKARRKKDEDDDVD